jgi:hypothetical protein
VLVRPAPPRTFGWRALVRSRRRVASFFVIVTIVAGNAAVAHDLVSANGNAARLRAEQQQLQAQLELRRNGVSALQTSIDHATRELRARTATRDRLLATAASARAATASTNRAVAKTLRSAGAQQARLDVLTGCLSILHRAMNALSVGDESNGSVELRNLDTQCDGLGR